MRKYHLIQSKEKTTEVYQLQAVIPASVVDLRKQCSPIENQGQLGSCTGHGIAGIMEQLENKTNQGESTEGNKFFRVSRLFIYYNERQMEGTIRSDAGALITDGIKTGKMIGYCNEALQPYIESKFAVAPPAACYMDAKNHRITSAKKILDINGMINCITSGYPFTGGIQVYESFESDSVAQTGIIPMPKKTEQCLGGHCIGFFGFNKNKNMFICRNSQGAEQGDGGYFYLPFEYVHKYASDCQKVMK